MTYPGFLLVLLQRRRSPWYPRVSTSTQLKSSQRTVDPTTWFEVREVCSVTSQGKWCNERCCGSGWTSYEMCHWSASRRSWTCPDLTRVNYPLFWSRVFYLTLKGDGDRTGSLVPRSNSDPRWWTRPEAPSLVQTCPSCTRRTGGGTGEVTESSYVVVSVEDLRVDWDRHTVELTFDF